MTEIMSFPASWLSRQRASGFPAQIGDINPVPGNSPLKTVSSATNFSKSRPASLFCRLASLTIWETNQPWTEVDSLGD